MKIDAILTLNIDNQMYTVSDLPPHVRNLVALLDSWRQTEADLHDQMTMLQMAQRSLTNDIVAAVQAAQNVPAPAPSVVEAPVEVESPTT
jgi:hypothetical protein